MISARGPGSRVQIDAAGDEEPVVDRDRDRRLSDHQLRGRCSFRDGRGAVRRRGFDEPLRLFGTQLEVARDGLEAVRGRRLSLGSHESQDRVKRVTHQHGLGFIRRDRLRRRDVQHATDTEPPRALFELAELGVRDSLGAPAELIGRGQRLAGGRRECVRARGCPLGELPPRRRQE